MRLLLYALPALLLSAAARADSPAPAASLVRFSDDPGLDALVKECLAARPELKAADALVQAERERVPQAGALQDPILSLAIQNDGFQGIQIGKMETSYWQVMVTQPLPWPGKLGLRTDVAATGVKQAEAAVGRARLTVEAEVRRAYLDLVLVRDRLGLLGRLEELWARAEGMARARYESGEGAQSDILRAQLERNRLRQRRFALEAEERTRLQAVNRLRAHPLDEPYPTSASVASLALPEVPTVEEAQADAERRSPELLQARLQVEKAAQQVALARRERYPDLAVTAGIMPRGSLDPMWQAGVSVSLPIFSGSKQWRAVAESEARAAASGGGAEAVRQLLRLRVEERVALLQSLVDSAQIYRSGLIVQSRATADSTMSQYRVGRVTFASVLEALGGVIADEDGALQAVAAAERVAIAAGEVSLDAPGGAGGGGLS
ncbi:MAG TPA: TolC family protein, partial [Anaeromyxobacteraceae bacterium]|nr:TolC family protein [Anaeromyxobacteraceae bacterium]